MGDNLEKNHSEKWCVKNAQRNFTYVAHPQADGHVEVTNTMNVDGIKNRAYEDRLRPYQMFCGPTEQQQWQNKNKTPVKPT